MAIAHGPTLRAGGIARNASPGTFSSTYSTRVVVGLMLSMLAGLLSVSPATWPV
jgi:hypothetical protein